MTELLLADRSQLHLLRKAWHFFCGALGLTLYYLEFTTLKTIGYFAVLIAILGFLVDFLRLRNTNFNKITLKIMGPLMRKTEEDGFSSLPFYALGAGLTIFFYKEDIALISLAFLVIADPIASIIGVLFGKEYILPHKTFIGTLSCYMTCFFITFIFLMERSDFSWEILVFSIISGLIGAGAEILSAFNIDDNLTIPVLSGLFISFLNLLIPLI